MKSQGKRSAKPSAADRTYFANLFASIAEEMGVALARTAYSPNIKERRDFSCAVFDARGRLIAQAAHIPVHLGALPMSVDAALRKFGTLEPGDVVILNDPYAGGTHLPDITLISPVFTPIGRTSHLIAYLVSRAHHADVGGMSPGSLPLSREVYQEGLRISPVKLLERGKPNHAIFDLIQANTRTPVERQGDLHAQLAAHTVGADRVLQTAQRHGAAILEQQMDDLLAYSKRLMQSTIGHIPKGVYTFEDALEGDGVTNDPIAIRLKLTIARRGASLDFTACDPQCAGSLNAVPAVTCSAVYYCFLCLLATPSPLSPDAFDAQPIINAGCFVPIKVLTKPGTIVHALPPAAVAGGNVETSQRIVDVVFGALASALPDVIPAASQGTMNNLTLGGIDPHRNAPFAYYETIAGGMGAGPGGPGLDAVHTHMTNTMNTPVEALEFAYPLRIERYEIATNNRGKSLHRGGHGVRRAVRVLTPTRGVLLTERRTRSPYGLAGGDNGKPGINQLIRNGKRKRLPAKAQLELMADDVIDIQTPGGGGWGGKVDS